MQETQVQSLGREDRLEKDMATHSKILAWKIPWTEEPGGLYSQWDHKESDMTEGLTPACPFDPVLLLEPQEGFSVHLDILSFPLTQVYLTHTESFS